jgi:drug/metabolite transporter (DMT)-like permease
MNVVKGILLKLASALLFAVMSAMIRALSAIVPLGQIVFFRSAFAIVPVVIIYALRRELMTAVRTGRPFGHVGRGLVGIGGMFLSFAALARLPLANATAIGFAAPLITVALAAVVLKERVRIYRWSAVGVGFVGVLVMLVPYLDLSTSAADVKTVGAVLGLAAALCNAASVIQTRRLTDSETNSAIVLYFSLICAVAALLTLPFAWHQPTGKELAMLIAIGMLGGFSHLLLTESYRLAPTSVVAPFDYTSIFWAFVLGYAMFGEVPSALVFVGAAIIALAGLFVIWRERQLGIERSRIRTG